MRQRRRLVPFLASLLCLIPLPAAAQTTQPVATQPVSRVAFGSCCQQSRPQPIWDAIVAARPELFILLGDNIYGDTQDMAVIRQKYETLANNPGFAKLRAATKLLATWDDHDYGKNDAGVEFPVKEASKLEFFRFMNEPTDSPRRTRGGVYDAYTFGPEGRRVQVILLDTRWFRSPLKEFRDERRILHYVPDEDPTKTVLGEEQWAWLEAQLRQPAQVRLIGSSIQVLSDQHRFEKWNNFPRERQRLLELIDRTEARGVVILSGDRHTAEISKLDRPGRHPLFDVTASSLNSGGGTPGAEPNAHRVGGDRFGPANFGMIEIDWSGPTPKLTLQIRDVEGKPVREQTLSVQ